jgi:hypothetical protein
VTEALSWFEGEAEPPAGGPAEGLDAGDVPFDPD